MVYNESMTFQQTIEILPDRRLEFDLPLELPLGRAQVEISIIPEKSEPITNGKTAFGCLKQYANPSKIPGEEGAWERAVYECFTSVD